ncbi:hypothetical protein QI305_12375 [Staphylococcus saprophyticus]|nr:hypothetical protein [Staphylococcus saprophyticus]
MENEVTIEHDKEHNILTFQAKGEVEFLENITESVISTFTNSSDIEQKDYVKAYDVNTGYIGEEVKIDSSDTSTPEHYITGIKKHKGYEDRYKCRYICSNCGTKENKYLYRYSRYMLCRLCNEKMKVTWIEDKYDVTTDQYKNFAFAGDYNPSL